MSKQIEMQHVSNLNECWINVYCDQYTGGDYVLGRPHSDRELAKAAAHITDRIYRIHVRLK